MIKRPSSPYPKRCNGHCRFAPVEPLSARMVRLRIARGYSVYELATAAGIFAGTIQRLESGKPADKRVFRRSRQRSATLCANDVMICQVLIARLFDRIGAPIPELINRYTCCREIWQLIRPDVTLI